MIDLIKLLTKIVEKIDTAGLGAIPNKYQEVIGTYNRIDDADNRQAIVIYEFPSGESSLSTKTIPYENDLDIYVYYNGVNITSSQFCTITANGITLAKNTSVGIDFAEGDEVAIGVKVGQYVMIAGNGISNEARSDAFAVTWDGDIHMQMDLITSHDLTLAVIAMGWHDKASNGGVMTEDFEIIT